MTSSTYKSDFDWRWVTAGGMAILISNCVIPPEFKQEVVQAAAVAVSAISQGQNPVAAIANSGKLDPKWSSKKSPEFLQKVVKIANELDANANYLMAIMQFESKLNHQAVNPLSNATGLIQFMPFTARRLGTSTSALLAMTEIEQLDYVRKYLMPYKGKLNTLGDFYASVLWPAAVGQPGSYVIARAGTIVYWQNNGFDRSRKGYITKADIAQLVKEKL